jgi:hypothetical protein
MGSEYLEISVVSNLLGADRVKDLFTRIRHQVRLELAQVHIQMPVESQRRRDGRHHLRNQAIQRIMVRARDVQVALADIVDSLIIDQERAVGILDGAVRRQDRIVRLHHGRARLRRGVHCELELRLLRKVRREALQQQRAEAGASAAAEGVEDEEALQAGAVFGYAADAVDHVFEDLFADGVVAAGI